MPCRRIGPSEMSSLEFLKLNCLSIHTMFDMWHFTLKGKESGKMYRAPLISDSLTTWRTKAFTTGVHSHPTERRIFVCTTYIFCRISRGSIHYSWFWISSKSVLFLITKATEKIQLDNTLNTYLFFFCWVVDLKLPLKRMAFPEKKVKH